MCRQFPQEAILLFPSDRVRGSWRFRQHRNQRWYGAEPGDTVVISISAGCAIEDRTRDFKRAIDRGGAGAGCDSGADKRLQGSVVNLVRLKVAEMSDQESSVPFDRLNGSLVA